MGPAELAWRGWCGDIWRGGGDMLMQEMEIHEGHGRVTSMSGTV